MASGPTQLTLKDFFPLKDYKGFCKFVCLQMTKHMCPIALHMQQFLKENFNKVIFFSREDVDK